jgi:hypothetical protein
LLAAAGFAACTSSSAIVTKTADPKPERSPVEVFPSAADVKRPYENLCLVSSWASSSLPAQKGLDLASEKAKAQARRCGADALIITGVSTVRGTQLNGTAIRYTDK